MREEYYGALCDERCTLRVRIVLLLSRSGCRPPVSHLPKQALHDGASCAVTEGGACQQHMQRKRLPPLIMMQTQTSLTHRQHWIMPHQQGAQEMRTKGRTAQSHDGRAREHLAHAQHNPERSYLSHLGVQFPPICLLPRPCTQWPAALVLLERSSTGQEEMPE